MYDEQEGWAHRYCVVNIREKAVVPKVFDVQRQNMCKYPPENPSFNCCPAAFLRDIDEAINRVCTFVV